MTDTTAPAAPAAPSFWLSALDLTPRAPLPGDTDVDVAIVGVGFTARTPAQEIRGREQVAAESAFGMDVSWLSAAEAGERCEATSVLGGVHTPHCAAIQPGRLVRGLVAAVERRGVAVYERTRALALRSGAVVTEHGTVRAPVVVRATEDYTPGLAGHGRTLAPVYSLMVATEPLPASFWSAAGLARRETFTDLRRMVIYGQRTADDRLAFGGRGAPYHFGSRVSPSFDRDAHVHSAIESTLVELFPALGPTPPVTHRWGGPLGVPRDWTASVGFDRATGLAWVGGCVGDGVGTANLARRTLADLISGTASELTALPWVGHRSRRWEPEPVRWLGINAALRVPRPPTPARPGPAAPPASPHSLTAWSATDRRHRGGADCSQEASAAGTRRSVR